MTRAIASTRSGLSPRVRGNPRAGPGVSRGGGSIPAGAGEPGRRGAFSGRPGVYPRGCGGTPARSTQPPLRPGLSPRVRGNRRPLTRGPKLVGSIPAGAGEPASGPGRIARRGVYPRGCGGTGASWRVLRPAGGLSPRVRGNPPRDTARSEKDGSIPAGAGEPSATDPPAITSEVYPRGCGGTSLADAMVADIEGLSPRVRGNRVGGPGRARRPGSIPAGAGEPPSGLESRPCSQVYPRGCGGTRAARVPILVPGGLSPRVRGNRSVVAWGETPIRSIPAGAGEPAGRPPH